MSVEFPALVESIARGMFMASSVVGDDRFNHDLWERTSEMMREDCRRDARAALDAILATHAVVELADEDSVADYGLYPVRTHNFGMPVAEQHDGGTRFRSISETRSYAAALLAVAAAAEAFQ